MEPKAAIEKEVAPIMQDKCGTDRLNFKDIMMLATSSCPGPHLANLFRQLEEATNRRTVGEPEADTHASSFAFPIRVGQEKGRICKVDGDLPRLEVADVLDPKCNSRQDGGSGLTVLRAGASRKHAATPDPVVRSTESS